MNIRTESLHFTADQKLLDYIDRKVNKLEIFYDRIIDATVYLKLENSGQIKDKIVEIKIRVPGDTLIAKEVSKTFEVGVDGAVGRLKRQIIKHKEKQRSYL